MSWYDLGKLYPGNVIDELKLKCFWTTGNKKKDMIMPDIIQILYVNDTQTYGQQRNQQE